MTGRHGAPFDVLGPHLQTIQGQRVWIVRAFLPGARAAWLVPLADGRDGTDGAAHDGSSAEALPMRPIHPAGLFSLVVPLAQLADRAAVPYRLRIQRQSGATDEIADPYAFPPLLTDYDLYLIGEGKHQRALRASWARTHNRWNGVSGTAFAVWAPNARRVSVVGDFNGWDERAPPDAAALAAASGSCSCRA